MGAPILHDRSKSRFCLEKGFFFSPLALNAQEAWSVLLLARMASTGPSHGNHAGHPDPASLAKATTKIMASLPASVRDSGLLDLEHIAYIPHPSTDGTRVRSLMQMLCRACAAREQVHLRYDDETGQPREFALCPIKVAFVHTEWFVAGIVVHPREATLLRLDRIAAIRKSDRRFNVPESFGLNDILGKAWKHQSRRRIHRVVLDFDPVVADEVESICWHVSQRTSPRADGVVRFEADVDGLDEIARWILQFSGHAIVRNPPELIRRVTRAAHDILAKYPGLNGNSPAPAGASRATKAPLSGRFRKETAETVASTLVSASRGALHVHTGFPAGLDQTIGPSGQQG